MAMISLALVVAIAGGAPAGAGELPVHVGGRVIEDEGALRFGWPGIYFEGRFRGSAVTVEAESATEHMRVLVDGAEKAVLVEPGRARLTIEGLSAGDHVVRLEKVTESQSGGGRFIGFSVGDGASPLPPMPQARQIEFIGDSYTVGYGNMSHGRTCTREEVHDLTNTQRAFGPLLARELGADYRINAYSGFGIVRNYNGGAPELSLPKIYSRAIPGEDASDASGGWHPRLIVVNLGTNDFSTPLREGERWMNDAELRADYRRTYGEFLRSLMSRQPQAQFILMGADAFDEDVEQVAAALPPTARARVRTLSFGSLDLQGCDWHPSLADHRKLADQLKGAIEAVPALWD